MTKKLILALGHHEISTDWWNFSKKTHEFSGTIGEYLLLKSFEITSITKNGTTSYSFKVNLCNSIITLTTINGFNEGAIQAIKLFLTQLGDKATIKSANRLIKINH